MIPERCKHPHCRGNMYLDPLDYDADGSTYTTGVDAFIGWECVCLLCSRIERDYSVEEVALTWGIPIAKLEAMRASSLWFLWRRGGTVKQANAAIGTIGKAA